ncbi:MAG: glycosyltransferase [Patescibacteria group bacterium]
MKVALVHDHLNQIGGAEKVLLGFKDIFPNSPIYTLLHQPKETYNLFNKFEIYESFLKNLPFAKKLFRWYLPLMPTAIESFNLNNYDVILSDASAFAKGIISGPKTKHICYCHTPTRYLWSDTHTYVESLKYGSIFKRGLMLVLNRLRLWDYQAAQRVDHFIANSEFIAQRIKKYYGREATVIYPPVDTNQFEISDQIGDYYLMISRLRPYKKVDLVIKAFDRLRIPLKIIGVGEEEKYLKSLAKDNIEFLGGVDDATKAKYLSHCKALIHPQEEDFGITAVEAMASGRPVIAYRGGGILETMIENETGVFFDEQTWEDLANKIITFDQAQFDPQKIKAQAEKFSRERFEREILGFVNKVVGV